MKILAGCGCHEALKRTLNRSIQPKKKYFTEKRGGNHQLTKNTVLFLRNCGESLGSQFYKKAFCIWIRP